MSFEIFVTAFFEKRLKNLSKKYPHLREDLKELFRILERQPEVGMRLQGCVGAIFKIRLPSSDMKRGKSGGFRIIYYVEKNHRVYLLTLYPKSERENISVGEINKILRQIAF